MAKKRKEINDKGCIQFTILYFTKIICFSSSIDEESFRHPYQRNFLKRTQTLLLVFNLILFLVFEFQCKRKENQNPIGIGYVLGDVCLHESPSVLSLCTSRLTSGEKVDVLEKDIKNEVSNRYMVWYKVKTNQKIGYVSQEEEEIKLHFSVIIPNSYESQMTVTASSLRLREFPSLTAKVLTSLPRGEIITAIGTSVHKFKVEDKWDNWVQIKTDSGISGFSYGGFLREVKEEQDSGTFSGEPISGFAELKENQPTFWVEPNRSKLIDEKDTYDIERSKSLLNSVKAGTRFPVEQKIVVNDETFYFLNREFCSSSSNSRDCFGTLSGWVSANELEFFEESLFSKTLKEYSEKEHLPLIHFLNNQRENSLEDVSTLKINKVPLGEGQSRIIWDVTYGSFDKSFNLEWEPRRLVRQVGNEFYILMENYSNSEIVDIDGDGVSEWKSTVSGRSDYALHIYSLQNSKFIEILRMESNDYSPDSCSFTINGKEVIDITPNTNNPDEYIKCSTDIQSPDILLTIGKKNYKYTLKSGRLSRTKA